MECGALSLWPFRTNFHFFLAIYFYYYYYYYEAGAHFQCPTEAEAAHFGLKMTKTIRLFGSPVNWWNGAYGDPVTRWWKEEYGSPVTG